MFREAVNSIFFLPCHVQIHLTNQTQREMAISALMLIKPTGKHEFRSVDERALLPHFKSRRWASLPTGTLRNRGQDSCL